MRRSAAEPAGRLGARRSELGSLAGAVLTNPPPAALLSSPSRVAGAVLDGARGFPTSHDWPTRPAARPAGHWLPPERGRAPGLLDPGEVPEIFGVLGNLRVPWRQPAPDGRDS